MRKYRWTRWHCSASRSRYPSIHITACHNGQLHCADIALDCTWRHEPSSVHVCQRCLYDNSLFCLVKHLPSGHLSRRTTKTRKRWRIQSYMLTAKTAWASCATLSSSLLSTIAQDWQTNSSSFAVMLSGYFISGLSKTKWVIVLYSCWSGLLYMCCTI